MQSKLLVALCLICGGAAIAWPRVPSDAASPYQVVHGWPQLPEGFALGQVSGVGVDSHDHIFVFHRGDRPILSFDGPTGKLLASWGDGMFATPHGLAVDSHDNVWVTDVGHHQVFKFSHNGELLMTVGVKDEPGQDGKHFKSQPMWWSPRRANSMSPTGTATAGLRSSQPGRLYF